MYRLAKGKKFEIYIGRFGSLHRLGIGKCLGSEKVWIVLHHGLMKGKTAKFLLKGRYIYGTQCEYRPVNTHNALESES